MKKGINEIIIFFFFQKKKKKKKKRRSQNLRGRKGYCSQPQIRIPTIPLHPRDFAQ